MSLEHSETHVGPHDLAAILDVPDHARGLVILAHGSGSSRHHPRNQRVAQAMAGAGFATLLLDLLSPEEETDAAQVFDINQLADRVHEASVWAHAHETTAHLRQGYFGASTGASGALLAASRTGSGVAAVVSRGGRPDLAGEDALAAVQAPTLLIVGSSDGPVIELNQNAYARLTCPKKIAFVPGGTHLFEEPATLEVVIREALGWFDRYLPARAKLP